MSPCPEDAVVDEGSGSKAVGCSGGPSPAPAALLDLGDDVATFSGEH